ncbi:Peroxisome biogenesis factor 10 [Porphyridium purpureum]|uniref:RING-type E3 ubiquitin transferase n=1 Tax=Porphyridium purpureum TaxID=35688 RepID=A0A5J4Z448_PORPP|nr:Peroxisome biogenesis factor 10 [Porphyridium purpureum]|eukprot:POR4470..scf295_1
MAVVDALALPGAETALVIRAVQKDVEYREELQRLLRAAVMVWVPNTAGRWNARLRTSLPGILDTAGDVVYYWLCVLGAQRRQTLGEEYCDIMQIRPSRTSRVHAARHLVTGLMYAFSSRTVQLVIKRLFRTQLGLIIKDEALSAMLEYAAKIHLAIFYFTSQYYEFARRCTGVQYANVGRNARTGISNNQYKLLGLLLSIQLVVQAALFLFRTLRRAARAARREQSSSHRESKSQRLSSGAPSARILLFEQLARMVFERPLEQDDGEQRTESAVLGGSDHLQNDRSLEVGMSISQSRSRKSCTLCLEAMRDPACTPCGHVFCWHCVAPWTVRNAACPLCRQELQLRDVLCLYNF